MFTINDDQERPVFFEEIDQQKGLIIGKTPYFNLLKAYFA